MTAELELTMRLRNNRLKERRLALGMSQGELAAAAGVSLCGYRDLEGMKRSPRRWGRWRSIAVGLANFHSVMPEDLFPDSVLAVEAPIVVRRVNGDDLRRLLSTDQAKRLEAPGVALERDEMREQIRKALAKINPRDAKALRLRFGLDDGRPRTLVEVGKALGVGPERARCLERRGLQTMQGKGRRLADYLPGRT